MNNEERILSMLEVMQATQEATNQRLERVENELAELRSSVVHIEVEHGKKLDALFDGYEQNAARLERIEAEVSRHEEVILKRVK